MHHFAENEKFLCHQCFKYLRASETPSYRNIQMHVAPLFAMHSKADHSINYLFKYLAFDFLESFS